MKRRLLDWVVCPGCGARPQLVVWGVELRPPQAAAAATSCEVYCALERAAVADSRPDCASCLREEITDGALTCACGAVYPIVAGVPRLIATAIDEHPGVLERLRARGLTPAPATPSAPPPADKRSRRSFGFQWAAYHPGERTWFKDDRTLRKEEFLFGMGASAGELQGRVLLDAGCGNGELTSAVAGYGLDVVGMDFSDSVVQAHRRLMASGAESAQRVHYLQGDVLQPPLQPGRFALVHSSGVIHHTVSTQRAFAALRRLVAPGGKLYVQVYRRRPRWIHLINVAARAVTTRMPLGLLWKLCMVTSPVHAALSRLMHACRGERFPGGTRRERALQMFDNYSPRYQHRHTVPEIEGMFRAADCEQVREVTLENERRHMLAVLGSLPLAVEPVNGPAPATRHELTASH